MAKRNKAASQAPKMELHNIKRKGKKEKESPDMEIGISSVFSQVGNICSLYYKQSLWFTKCYPSVAACAAICPKGP